MHFDWPNGHTTDVTRRSDAPVNETMEIIDHDAEGIEKNNGKYSDAYAIDLAQSHIQFGYDLIEAVTGRTFGAHMRGMPGAAGTGE
jgi:hypothetical protein